METMPEGVTLALSDIEFHTGKEGTGHGGPIDVARIAVGTLVEILLVGIEDVLEAGVHLECGMPVETEIIGHLEAHIHEATRATGAVGRDIARMMLHKHGARIGARKGYGQGLEGRPGGSAIAVCAP